MIRNIDKHFIIDTKSLTYVFHINSVGLPIFDYFGDHIEVDKDSLSALGLKEACAKGTSTIQEKEINDSFSADNNLLEYSFAQKGDYKDPAIIVSTESRGYTMVFKYDNFEINHEIKELEELPSPHHMDEELIIRLKEVKKDLYLELHYLISNNHDVIVRNASLINKDKEEVLIEKMASLQFDNLNKDFSLLNLNGAWATESQATEQKIYPGIYINDSKTGNSSNKHNPFFLIKETRGTEDYGDVYAFNLMYSGNHQELVELNVYDHLHIQTGINPYMFKWKLQENETFNTPFALITYSSKGTNLSSQRMHEFINDCVVNENFGHCLRPVLINNWEGTYFNFKESKLLSIAKAAKEFGVELFVLDDGWFSLRNNDTQGLGDYDVNRAKLPHGLDGLAKKINKMGMKFGLWFEPESVNKDSNLYLEHPEYAITAKEVNPSQGRNQLLLDLSKPEVQDYIIDNVCATLASANIEYVKWDMNRNMSDVTDAGFYHKYILGLYKVIKTITSRYPKVLFEGCASGGNRFDLGMLRFFPQTWASDCTDPYERLQIQGGLMYGYPQSCITAHVSHRQNHQTLRSTAYSTKFNIAVFGCLGYELMLNELNKVEKEEIKHQISFYKEHRELLQFSPFSRKKEKSDFSSKTCFSVVSKDGSEGIIGVFSGVQTTRPAETILQCDGFLPGKKYKIQVLDQPHNLSLFGNLINMVVPVHLNCDGWIVRSYAKSTSMKMETEYYEVDGSLLKNGIILKSEWAGNGYNENVRILGDFGSRLYYIKRID